MVLAGVDLAWQSEKNGSGLAFGVVESDRLRVLEAYSAVVGLKAIRAGLARYPKLTGLAIDAPLIINNAQGQRECERLLARRYASRKASCHASNLNLYPAAASVELSKELQVRGFAHAPSRGNFQLECYPHPALIEIFGLPERLAYKKGKVFERRNGQIVLAGLLENLQSSPVLSPEYPAALTDRMRPAYIESLRGQALKDNEDLLDAIVCLYVAALFAKRQPGQVFGTTQDGYIYVPQVDCRARSGNTQPKLKDHE